MSVIIALFPVVFETRPFWNACVQDWNTCLLELILYIEYNEWRAYLGHTLVFFETNRLNAICDPLMGSLTFQGVLKLVPHLYPYVMRTSLILFSVFAIEHFFYSLRRKRS